MKTSVRAFVALAAGALTACGPRVTVPAITSADVPVLQGMANDPEGLYRLEAGDVVQVRFPFQPERDQQEIVRPDGTIRAKEIGDVMVTGLSVVEAANLLIEKSPTLRNPEVIVSVVQFAPKSVYVAGEVGTPGLIDYREGLTALQALAEAGGLLDSARRDGVILIRQGAAPGESLSRRFDVDGALDRDGGEHLMLAPHDVLYVPRSGIATADLWVEQHFTKLVPFFQGASGGIDVNRGR